MVRRPDGVVQNVPYFHWRYGAAEFRIFSV
jgi:hypothetical protein